MKRIVSHLLVAVVFGALGSSATWWQLAKKEGRTQEISGTTYREINDPINPLREVTEDKNKDGKPDEWLTAIRENRKWGGDYYLSDENFDGTPDKVTMAIDGAKTSMSIYDHNYDGEFDHIVVSNKSRIDANDRYAYLDLDLDGRLDTAALKSNGESREFRIRMGDSWVNAGHKAGDPWESARILLNGIETPVTFRDREWVATTP